jgi:hypothetical protein
MLTLSRGWRTLPVGTGLAGASAFGPGCVERCWYQRHCQCDIGFATDLSRIGDGEADAGIARSADLAH